MDVSPAATRFRDVYDLVRPKLLWENAARVFRLEPPPSREPRARRPAS